jgi:hypothetical protein
MWNIEEILNSASPERNISLGNYRSRMDSILNSARATTTTNNRKPSLSQSEENEDSINNLLNEINHSAQLSIDFS